MKNKVVINRCWGGFSLSEAAMARLHELGSPHVEKLSEEEAAQRIFESSYICSDIPRHDSLLLQVVDELGVKAAAGDYAELAVVEIDGNQYCVDEYDGMERVDTPLRHSWVTIEPAGVTIA